MKTYNNLQLREMSCKRVLVDDGGNAPTFGETVTIDGRLATVVESAKELINDSGTGGRFIAVFKP